MGCNVYANGNEIACKAGGGKVVAAFPDVCLSPPSPPAGPIPVPYPDTSFAKDTKNGSKTVKIKRKEVMLKDKSFYKSSPLGDEAATKSLGAGVVTHVITGKTYFTAWSMDVKFDGANVDRHIDLTTSNHASPAGNSMIMANLSQMAQSRIKDDKCPCCGGTPHSDAQKQDLAAMKADPNKPSTSLSEDEYYGKLDDDSLKNELNGVRGKNDKCKLLPDKDTPPECNRYYPMKTSADRPNSTVSEATTSRNRWSKSGAGKRFRRANPSSFNKYAHRVPIGAGGCPTGGADPTNTKNVTPINDQECVDAEAKLDAIHSDLAIKIRGGA